MFSIYTVYTVQRWVYIYATLTSFASPFPEYITYTIHGLKRINEERKQERRLLFSCVPRS